MINSWIFSFIFCLAVTTALEIEYYWKDYDGVAPSDAFVAVKNDNDTTAAYIGQGFAIGQGIFPGTLYPNSTSVEVTYNGVKQIVSENLKILATQRSYSMKWAKIHYGDIEVLKKLNFIKIVEGGMESSKGMYIGRTFHEGSMQIGKVYNVKPYQGLTLPNKEFGTTTFEQFEILLYIESCW